MSYAPNFLFLIEMQKLTKAFRKYNVEYILKQQTEDQPDNLIREHTLKKLMIMEMEKNKCSNG